MGESQWKDFDLAKLVERAGRTNAPYLEFLRVPQLSCGIYTLRVGALDSQSTHDEDEVYFVLKGSGAIELAGERRELKPGSILYVPADMDHEFVEIHEELSLLVFFGSGGPSGADV
jgi:mannose-6-phosphate isomerase-like protein (cupin superfamily)